MEQLRRISADLAKNFFYLLSFLGYIVAVILFPLLFLALPILLLVVVINRFILFQKVKFHARKNENAKESGLLHSPNVLIIEDDPDVASATAKVFKQLGCNTEISDGHDGVSYKMCYENYDYIVLDWKLGEDLQGDAVVRKSVEMIDNFNDLRIYFKHKHPQIITYSVLNKPEITLPKNKYFNHVDHWHKPVNFSDLKFKAAQVLTAGGY